MVFFPYIVWLPSCDSNLLQVLLDQAYSRRVRKPQILAMGHQPLSHPMLKLPTLQRTVS